MSLLGAQFCSRGTVTVNGIINNSAVAWERDPQAKSRNCKEQLRSSTVTRIGGVVNIPISTPTLPPKVHYFVLLDSKGSATCYRAAYLERQVHVMEKQLGRRNQTKLACASADSSLFSSS